MFTRYRNRNSDCQVAATGWNIYPKYSPAGARTEGALQEGAGGSGSSRAKSAGVLWPGGAWKASTALPVMNCKALRENQELKRKKKKPARSQIGDRMSVRLTRAARNIQGSEGARSVGWEPDETDGQMEASPARQILANKFFPGGRRQAQLSSRGRNENMTWVGAWSLPSLPRRAPQL